MADDDQQAPQQRYWFPYWTSPPAPAPRPALRPQLSRRDTRPPQPQPPPPVTPSPSRRQPQPAQPAATAASRDAGGAGSPQAQPQPTRLSSRPSPSRAHPLSPIREPNSSAAAAPASALKETKPQAKPATTPQRAAHEVPKELDIIVPQEKIIHEPPSNTKAHSKAVVEKEKEEKKGKDKEQEREKHKDGKEKEKEKERKEKKDKDKHKEEHDESKGHGGKLHKELKAGVADMVHKLSASAAPAAGHNEHERRTSKAGTTVITLAGENKGASMKIGHADLAESKDAAAKERRARKLDDGKQEAQHGAKGMSTFVNSNVQVVNNSLVLQSSCSSSDPGVHLKLSTKSKKKGDEEEAGGKGAGAAAAAKKK